MQFFDLNIPYLEDPQSSSYKTTPSQRAARKKTRLQLVVKAIELGLSGIAYNRSINGAISESERCSIPLFPLSSLLALSPSLSSSASFHRLLLSGGANSHSPFRQYTRITVSVDNPSQSSALNSGNSVLKTYDLVAVRPLNQVAFDQACQFSDVDLIAIDFSDKMQFRLRLPMIRAAIARGVYFEITYSGLIDDVHVKRQIISNAKLLVDWTRGKNLIVSSAAPSVLEFRGPNDVANLLSLLGIATEHAKAAISKNCRSLIAKTLKKKEFFKEAIRVDRMPSVVDPKKPWIIGTMEWDPISSGEGDLLLEDLAKSFSEASKRSETLKSNGLAVSMNTISSDALMVTEGAKIKELDDANNTIASSKKPCTSTESVNIRPSSQQKPVSLFSIPLDHGDVSTSPLKQLFESNYVVTDSVSILPCFESKLNFPDVPAINFDTDMMSEAQTSIFSQKCQDVEADATIHNDAEASAMSNDLIFASETTPSMMVDDINTETYMEHVMGSSPPSNIGLASQLSPISSGCSIKEASEVKECEETSKELSLHAQNMDFDSGGEGENGDPVLPVEDKRHMERGCCMQETNVHLSNNSDDTSDMDPSEKISCGSDFLVHDSMIHGDSMELQVEGETEADANHLSKTATKAVKQRLQQRRYSRSPFKHLLQVPFKRKAFASINKLRKR